VCSFGSFVGVALSLATLWLLFIAALVVLRPRGVGLGDAKRFVPDVVRLLRDLARDESLSAGVRRRLGSVLGYLALPFDLVPDFIPVLGYADDVIVVALVLRPLVRNTGPAAIERHWSGSPAGLAVIRRLAGIPSEE